MTGAFERDLVVVGASSGGVEAIPRLLSQLPADFGAAVCVVQHLLPSSQHLADIFQRATPLPVSWARHDEPLLPGHVYVAPGGIHMVVTTSTIQLVDGPRESWSRPSISRLFRSAAASHGDRTIGCILTGMLDDGAAGAIAIKAAGGVIVVQDPSDAECPDMPKAALRAVDADHVLPLDELGAALVVLSRDGSRRPPARAAR